MPIISRTNKELTNFDSIRSHFPLEAFLKSQERGVDCIFEFHFWIVSFLEELFSRGSVPSNRSRTPREIGAYISEFQ
jgi:hypothetical protein